CMQTVDYPWTF
nr:immunoglobulin light chain junction region [Macaca mulatta]MOW42460.1 immunoglobulin light chain junction region [Macaca mulatta]